MSLETLINASADDELLRTILPFLAQIGLIAREGAVPADSFLPGVCIRGGELVFDRARLQWPCDLLHEAGHLAVTPAAQRAALMDTLQSTPPHGGEVEALAWSFAAATHLAIPASVLFHGDGYRGKGEALALSYSMGVYPGAHGLVQCGLAATDSTAPRYPALLRWLRE